MFCQLLAVSMGRSHVVAWPGRPLGGQSSAPGHPCHGHCRLSRHARSDPLSLCPDTGLGTPRLPWPSALGMPPPQDEDETRRLGGRAGPRTMRLMGQSWGVGPGGRLWSLLPPCWLLPWC